MGTFAKISGRITLAILLILTLAPFFLLVLNSFKSHNEIVLNPWILGDGLRLSNYAKAFNQVARPMLNSLSVTICVVIVTVVVSLLASYSFVRFQFAFSGVLYYGIIAMLMIPSFAMLIPQFIQIKAVGLYNTMWGLILPPAAYSVAMGTFLIRGSLESLPKSLFEAATMEGAGDLDILVRIVIPISKPIISTVTIMTGLNAWNNYLWPLVSSTGEKTQQIAVALTKMVVSVVDGNGVLFAGYIIASLPLIILFCVASKSFVTGLTQGSVKG
ncbi:MAG: carbohydrate ABC transporter permease [Lachnospiraceae bacterium]